MPFKDAERKKAYSKEYYRTHKKETREYYLKNKNSFEKLLMSLKIMDLVFVVAGMNTRVD